MKKQTTNSAYKLVILFAVQFFLFPISSYSQIGLKIAQVKPMADFGANFSKAPSFEFIYHLRAYEGKLLSKVSFTYANFKPRQDTIPIYLVQFQNGYKVFPGSLVYDNLSTYGLSIDNQFRIFKTNDFEFFAGIGLSFTRYNLIYSQTYETKLISTTSKKDFVAGGNVSLLGLYNINNHFAVFADIQYQMAAFTDWSSKFHNRKIGIGFLYTIKDKDDY